jgi:hypothetical protein
MDHSPEGTGLPTDIPDATLEEIVERAAAYFESVLWESEIGDRVRARLLRAGIDESTLRSFRVGYAPGNTNELLGHLVQWEYSTAELTSAGIVNRSNRSVQHARFHARIIFPIANAEGRVAGFAGLATHLGPSWPLWLTSPDQGLFDAGSAIFGIHQATPAIAQAGRALILQDCVQLLALNQQGRCEVVGVIQSPITRRHAAQLATTLRAGDLQLARRAGALGVVAVPAGADVDEEAFAARATPDGLSLIDSTPRTERSATGQMSVSTPSEEEVGHVRLLDYLVGALMGVGIPIGLVLVAAPHDRSTRGSTPTLNVAIIGVAAVYLLLWLFVSRVSARARARSQTRRMREPWIRGKDEWQPSGWTYHRLEDVLVGAALASTITCVALLMTVGGFLG